MRSAEATGMTAPTRRARAVGARRRTHEKTGDELSDCPAATFGAYLRAVLQEPLHEHLETVSTLFTLQIIRGHLLQHPHAFELVDDPSKRYRRGGFYRLADQHQGKRSALRDGAHQRRVLIKGSAVNIDVVDGHVFTVVELKIAIDISDCLFQRQRRCSATASTGVVPARTGYQDVSRLERFCFHQCSSSKRAA